MRHCDIDEKFKAMTTTNTVSFKDEMQRLLPLLGDLMITRSSWEEFSSSLLSSTSRVCILRKPLQAKPFQLPAIDDIQIVELTGNIFVMQLYNNFVIDEQRLRINPPGPPSPAHIPLHAIRPFIMPTPEQIIIIPLTRM